MFSGMTQYTSVCYNYSDKWLNNPVISCITKISDSTVVRNRTTKSDLLYMLEFVVILHFQNYAPTIYVCTYQSLVPWATMGKLVMHYCTHSMWVGNFTTLKDPRVGQICKAINFNNWKDWTHLVILGGYNVMKVTYGSAYSVHVWSPGGYWRNLVTGPIRENFCFGEIFFSGKFLFRATFCFGRPTFPICPIFSKNVGEGGGGQHY
jgi:hypothetical protein